ncbi:MAG: PqqD family protein, partial [Ktedonobacteraceae bacterium]
EVVKYERLHYLYTYQTMPEDAFTAINAQHPSKAVPLRLASIPVILPGVYRERFAYPIVSLIDALHGQQPLEELINQSGCYDLVFQREVHTLTLNVFTLNAETSLLLDLCQKEQTIATLIAAVEQQLEETGLADDILAMLGALQEKQIIGVRDEQ